MGTILTGIVFLLCGAMLFFSIYDTIAVFKKIKKLVKLVGDKSVFDDYVSEKFGERRTLDPHEIMDFKWHIIDEIKKKDATLYGMLYDRFFKSDDDGIYYINAYFLKTNKLQK